MSSAASRLSAWFTTSSSYTGSFWQADATRDQDLHGQDRSKKGSLSIKLINFVRLPTETTVGIRHASATIDTRCEAMLRSPVHERKDARPDRFAPDVRAVSRRSLVRLGSAEFTAGSYEGHVRALRAAWDAGVVPSSRPGASAARTAPTPRRNAPAPPKPPRLAPPIFPDPRPRSTTGRSRFQRASRGAAGPRPPSPVSQAARWQPLRPPGRSSRP